MVQIGQKSTLATFGQVFGSAEYSIAGILPNFEEINEIQIKINAQTDLEPFEDVLILTPCLKRNKEMLVFFRKKHFNACTLPSPACPLNSIGLLSSHFSSFCLVW